METVRKCTLAISALICLTWSTQNAQAQEVLRSSLRDSIKINTVEFLISKGYLEAGKQMRDYDKRIYFFELATETVLGYKTHGIYMFSVASSETPKFILILDSNNWKILTTDELGWTLKCASDFFVKNKTPNGEALKLTKAIVEIYEYNERY